MRDNRLKSMILFYSIVGIGLITLKANKDSINDKLFDSVLNESTNTTSVPNTNETIEKIMLNYNDFSKEDYNVITYSNTTKVYEINGMYYCDNKDDKEYIDSNYLNLIYVVTFKNEPVCALSKYKEKVINIKFNSNITNYTYLDEPTENDYENLKNGYLYLYYDNTKKLELK